MGRIALGLRRNESAYTPEDAPALVAAGHAIARVLSSELQPSRDHTR
jgi:hypothetical protein